MHHTTTPARMSRALLILAATGTALFPSGPVGAQVIPSPYEFIDAQQDIEIFVGATAGDRGSFELGPGGGPVLGARAGRHVSGPLSVEGTGYLLSTDRLIWDPRGSEPLSEPIGESSMVVGVINARARFTITGQRTWRGLAPHLIGGAGVAVSFKEGSDVEDEAGLTPQERYSFGPAFVGMVGVGTRWLPFDRLGFRIDAGLNLWRIQTPPAIQGLEEELERSIPENEWAGARMLTVGGSFRF